MKSIKTEIEEKLHRLDLYITRAAELVKARDVEIREIIVPFTNLVTTCTNKKVPGIADFPIYFDYDQWYSLKIYTGGSYNVSNATENQTPLLETTDDLWTAFIAKLKEWCASTLKIISEALTGRIQYYETQFGELGD